MKTILLVFVLLVCGCHYATAPDPCPMPPEQHPEAWTPIKDTTTGQIVGYVCGRQHG